MLYQNRAHLLEKISTLRSNDSIQEVEGLVLAIIESVDNILKLINKKLPQQEQLNSLPDEVRQVSLIQKHHNSQSPLYWRNEYTEIYKKWDYQNRIISRLQTQIQQLERDGKQPKKKYPIEQKEMLKLSALYEKQTEILELQEQQNQLLRRQLLESQKNVDELNQMISTLTLKKEEETKQLSYQIKESQTQVESLTQILSEQEKEIDKLNEDNLRQGEELKKMNIKENEQALSRMRGVSNAIKTSVKVGYRGSFSEPIESLIQSRDKSFSFSNKKSKIQHLLINRQETIKEEDEEALQLQELPHIVISEPNVKSVQTDFEVEDFKQNEINQLKDKLLRVKIQYEKRISELEMQQDDLDSEAPSESIGDLKLQIESLKQEFELQQEKFALLKNELIEKGNAWQNSFYMVQEDLYSRLQVKRVSLYDEVRTVSQSVTYQNDEEEVKRLEQSMKANMKRMLMMKDKMIKLKMNLEEYGEKIGIINGRKRSTIIETNQNDQQLQVSELINEFLKTIDSINDVQRQIQDDYDRRIQKENEKQMKLVQQNLLLKQELRQQKSLQDEILQEKKKSNDLEQELQKVKLDKHNLNELLHRNQKENGNGKVTQSCLKIHDDQDAFQRLNARSSTISIQNMMNEKQEQEIKTLKKEIQEAQDLINRLYKQQQNQSDNNINSHSGGRVSMIGQGFEAGKNDKQTQYLSKRVADLQKKLDLKSAELFQETQRSQQLRLEYEEIVSTLEEEIRLRDLRLQELHQQLLESKS